jgi:hypothetical protein
MIAGRYIYQLVTHGSTVRLDFLALVSQRGVIGLLLGANSDVSDQFHAKIP